MKYRKHHNNKGYRQIKEGKTRLYIEYLKKKLNKIIGTNKMEQTQEQNKSLAQQLVDEYYGNYEKVKPSEAELPNILSIVEFMLDKYHLGISIEPLKMTVERIKEIQKTTGYPDSIPVQQALLQVWNEVAQEHKSIIDEACKKQRHECALVYEDTIEKDQRYQETYYRILNAPSPKESE